MGSTVAPKMFSQPGVFGSSDTTGVVNKTNPVAGLAGGAVAPPPAPAPASAPAVSPNPTSASATTSINGSSTPNLPTWLLPQSNSMRPAFYGY